MVSFSLDERVPKGRGLRILKLCILLEEHAYLKNDFVKIFLLGIVVRCIGLNGLIVLKDRVKLLERFQPHPALTQ